MRSGWPHPGRPVIVRGAAPSRTGPNDCPGTIAPASALPKLTSPVTVDGYTQPGASPNTNPPDQGLNTVLRIEIDCTNAGTYCLVIGADDVTIRGLVFNRGIGGVATDFLTLVHNPVIEGCFFGTTPDGLTALALPAGTVRSRLSRLITHLRTELDDG